MLSQPPCRTPLLPHLTWLPIFANSVRRTKTSPCGKKKRRKLGSQLTCPSSEPLSHSLTRFPSQLPQFCRQEACTWSVAFSKTWRRCWHTHGWISSCQLPPQLSSCCCSGPPPYAALSLCWDFPVTPGWISRSLHLLPQLPKEFHISTAIWVFPSSATLPVSPSDALYFSEDLLRLYALGVSSSSRISQSHYCALVREAWEANSVFCLRYGMRNQEKWLLSCFCHRPSGKPGQKSFILCNFDKAYKYSLQDRRAFTSPSANAALDSFENPE